MPIAKLQNPTFGFFSFFLFLWAILNSRPLSMCLWYYVKKQLSQKLKQLGEDEWMIRLISESTLF